MRYPHDLPDNGTIAFAAPSFGCATEPYLSAFENAEARLESLGYQLIEGPNARRADGIGISASPEECGAELNDLLSRPEVDAVIACGGGEMMCTDLDFVDFDAIRRNPPKWFMGFSDNTNLTYLLPTLCDTAAVYGPNAPAFGMEPWHPVLYDALWILSGKIDTLNGYPAWEIEGTKDEAHPLEPYNVTVPTEYVAWPEGDTTTHMTGRLIGGCLDCLSNLAGTTFDRTKEFCERYKEDGILFFFESCDLNVLDMQRALWRLEHCGWFRHVNGFLIGRPYHYQEDMMGLNQYDAVVNVLGKYNVPILMDADLGHLPPSMPLIVGAKAEILRMENRLTVKFQKV